MVRELSRRLASEGWIDPWVDEKKLLPGQDWRTKIEEAVETSDIVIICLSSNSVSKEGFVQKELRYAREIAFEKPDGTIFLVPLRFDDCTVPRGLRFYQWGDYFGDKEDETYSALLESLKLRYEQKLKLEGEEQARKEKERQDREAREKAAREKAERVIAERMAREEAERIAREKAKREAVEKAKRERRERLNARKVALAKAISESFTALKSTLPKAKPFLRIAGFTGIAIALLWGSSWAIPKFVSFLPTPKPSATITPVPPTKAIVPILTKTKTPTSTPVGGEQVQIIFLSGDAEQSKYDIYSVNIDGTQLKQLTFKSADINHPVWSPSGDKIAFSMLENGFYQFYLMNPDGSGLIKISKDAKKEYGDLSWAPDGNKLAFDSKQGNGAEDIFTMNSDGSDEVQLTNIPASDRFPTWSPNGKKIAFISNRSSFSEIYVMNADGTEQNQLTFLKAGVDSLDWSPDGEYIVFSSTKDHNLWEIYNMKSDGTEIVRLTNNDIWDLRPKYAPDGTKIYWDSCCFELHAMNPDGTGVTNIFSSKWGWDFQLSPSTTFLIP